VHGRDHVPAASEFIGDVKNSRQGISFFVKLSVQFIVSRKIAADVRNQKSGCGVKVIVSA
jgi:hypothetical protein